MPAPTRVPACFGHLHSEEHPSCMQCLLQDDCLKAMAGEKVPEGSVRYTDLSNLPTKKPQLILLVCRKFGLPTVWKPKGRKEAIEITEANIGEYYNLDWLLTNKDALRHLLSVGVVVNGSDTED